MKMFLKSALLTSALILAVPAQAQTYNLATDYSNTNNPNGVWSFTRGATPMVKQPAQSTGNPFDLAATNGYWGSSTDYNSSVSKVTVNGTAAAPYNNGDFLAGDVIIHSSNPNTFSPLTINWTAAAAGSIDFTSSVWYAHSVVTRSNDVQAFLGNTSLGTVTVNNSITRTNAITSLAGTGLAVLAGDVLSFRFSPTSSQQFGSLAGIGLTVNFTPRIGAVPEPGTWAMMLFGFGLVGSAMRRGRRSLALV
jgi:PEP-CTERM motif